MNSNNYEIHGNITIQQPSLLSTQELPNLTNPPQQLSLSSTQELPNLTHLPQEELPMYSQPHQEMSYYEDTSYIIDFMSIQMMLLLLIMIIWIFGGLAGFITSIVCLFYNSKVEEKVIGLLASIIIGPFFWLYYIYSETYCSRY